MVTDWSIWRAMERGRRGPAWRHQLALATRQHIESLDAATRREADFFRMCSRGLQGRLRAERTYPDLAGAEAVWADPFARGPLQLLLLGNCLPADIADRLSLDPQVLQAVEDLYFDVRAMLKSSFWIVTKVIEPEADRGHDDLAAQMRLAFYGGPYAAMALIDAKIGLPTDAADRLYAANLLLHAKFVQAMEMPLSPEQLLDFTNLYADIRRDEQRIQVERDKLAFRMQRWSQRLELARARIEPAGYGFEKGNDEDSASIDNTDVAVTIRMPPDEAA